MTLVENLTTLYRLYCFYASPGKFILRKILRAFFEAQPPCSIVLEIGSGNSMMHPCIKTACRTKQFLSTDIAPTEKTQIVCNGESLSFLDRTLDAVMAFQVIEHVPGTQQLFLESHRVLKQGGFLVLSLPFLYGQHDAHDFYRWTTEGIEYVLDKYGFKPCITQKVGGTFSTILTLFFNYIHAKLTPPTSRWRNHRLRRKLYLGGLAIIFSPFSLLSWLCFGLDALVDKNSLNSSNIICIAQKILTDDKLYEYSSDS